MQHGAAEAPFLDFQATHTLGRSQGHAYLLTLYMGAEEPAGKRKEAPPNSAFKSFHLIPEILWGVLNGGRGLYPLLIPWFLLFPGDGVKRS